MAEEKYDDGIREIFERVDKIVKTGDTLVEVKIYITLDRGEIIMAKKKSEQKLGYDSNAVLRWSEDGSDYEVKFLMNKEMMKNFALLFAGLAQTMDEIKKQKGEKQ